MYELNTLDVRIKKGLTVGKQLNFLLNSLN